MPLVPWVPALSAIGSEVLMASLPRSSWERLLIRMANGIALYFVYGYRHSKLRGTTSTDDPIPRAVSDGVV